MEKDDNQSTVLVIEDNTELREYIVEKLSLLYHCLSIPDGRDGWKMAQEHLPDLIITDWMMPGMTGIEIVEKLKSSDETKHLPVIMLTARDAMEDKLSGLIHGADDYLTKPFNIEELLIRCSNILQSREALKNKLLKDFILNPTTIKGENREDAFLQRLKEIIEANLADSEFSIVKLQELMGVSRMVLHRKLKALTNFSPVELIRAMKMEHALKVFKESKGVAISEVAYQLGFSDPSYFSRCFKQYFGFPPKEIN